MFWSFAVQGLLGLLLLAAAGVPAGAVVTPSVRVNSGGAAWVAPDGMQWAADTGFSGGRSGSTSAAISGTTTPRIYQSARVGTFAYQFALPDGAYQVTFKFAELWASAVGRRKFAVDLNGVRVLNDFDIFAAAGGRYKAIDRSFSASVTGGKLLIRFTGQVGNALINAIEVVAAPPPAGSAPPSVSVTLTPTSVRLEASQTQAFAASVSGTANTAVNWSLSPPVGSLSTSGTTAVYTAPSTLEQRQTVEVVATSVADPTKFAKALLTLVPVVAVAVSPAQVELLEGEGQQFTATVSGAANKSVTWSIEPALGSVDGTGFYRAPAALAGPATVALRATSVADPSKSSQAGVTLRPKPKVEFTLSDMRLTSLSYNGQSFYAFADYLVQGAWFQAPDGKVTATGWIRPSSRNKGSNPDYFEHVYNQGGPRQFTVKVVWTIPDARTLRTEAYVTNQDPTESIIHINLYYLPVKLPGPARQYNRSIPLSVDQYYGRPAALLSGDWGSLAFWQEGYPTNAVLWTHYGAADQTEFRITLSSSTQFGANVYRQTIRPGETQRFVHVLRFGEPEETLTTLAPEPFEEFRQAFPQLVNWPDRRPVGMWFVAEGSQRSATNPRGYLWNPQLNVADRASFRRLLLAKADEIINRMNQMQPRPQGIIVWDLEGQEFNHAFTYIGYPNKLNELAPEMDAVADELFERFRAAGYHVGVTIRPQIFDSGYQLPPRCSSEGYPWVNDKFLKLDAVFPYRLYRCRDGAWEATLNGPGAQKNVDIDAQILDVLRAKISYARNRWGARLFYVDSNAYTGQGAVNPMIFRTLAAEFSDCLLFPELETDYYWGSSAPYNEARMDVYGTSADRKSIYPNAFSLINVADVDLSAKRDLLVQGVRGGDILLFRAWFGAPEIGPIQSIYREAWQSTP